MVTIHGREDPILEHLTVYDQRLAASEGQLSFVYRQIMSEKQDVENGSAAVDKNAKVLAKASNTTFLQF